MGQPKISQENRPQLAGDEAAITVARAATQGQRFYPGTLPGHVRSAFGCALHMHQPLILDSDGDLRNARVVGNLQRMAEHGSDGDRYNAGVFRDCYARMGRFVPELIAAGKQPRIMLEYSGTLLHGLQMSGAEDVLQALRRITVGPEFQQQVEWLGCPWGHAVAPSTPVQDFRLNVIAWQSYFASLFGQAALNRVRGFSPSEMALPNHPDVAFEFVKTLKDCGYRWVLVQEGTIERLDGGAFERDHLPRRLVCRNSRGETVSIIALVKTQGSDTKLVAQMQPYGEARGLNRRQLAGRDVPPFVVQISDGENGGVMMNDFPPQYQRVMHECAGSDTPAMNGTEYLEHLAAMGLREEDFAVVQPRHQKRLWDRFQAEGSERLAQVIEELRREGNGFNMEGGSWTSEISWVRGYDDVMQPLERSSADFHRLVLERGVPTTEPRYTNALYHLLMAQTSCFRYWGTGLWTEYAKEFVRRLDAILKNDF